MTRLTNQLTLQEVDEINEFRKPFGGQISVAMTDSLIATCRATMQENERLRQALASYADPSKWQMDTFSNEAGYAKRWHHFQRSPWEMAQKVIANSDRQPYEVSDAG